ncbi:MAG: CehA/McbA family metallohydrolase, partial [Planctomycetes bacterium]|nr:CehA/McbA family metallohydrolase [Planctomycetota bacterium]
MRTRLLAGTLLALASLAAAGPPPELRCRFGSTHAHCWLETGGDDGGFRTDVPSETARREPSDGEARRAFRRDHADLYRGGTPADAFRYAREKGGLDFLALTIHSHMATPAEYAAIRDAAAEANRRYGGAFCALAGQEWSTISSGNHVNILGATEICASPNGRYDALYERWLPARAEAPVVVLNHPFRAQGELDRRLLETEYGLDDFGGDPAALARAANPHVHLIEVVTGPAFGRLETRRRWRGNPDGYFRQLNRGLRVAPCAGSDNHYQNWGTSSPARTGVWTRDLSPAEVLSALRARRTFATEDENLSLWLEAEGVPMGGTLATAATRVRASLWISDGDEPRARYRVRWIADPDGVLGDEAKVVREAEGVAGEVSLDLDLP